MSAPTVGLASTGTLFQYDAGGGSYTTIACVVDVGGPDRSIGEKKVTPLSDTTRHARKIPTLGDGGKVTLKLEFKASEWSTFVGFKFTQKTWRILYTQASKWDFEGFWTKFGNRVDGPEDTCMVDAEISIDGEPTFTA